ncbi:uncharacterized protein LOC125706891 isoform X7 [Brienomyrus brachyistius]|uniref:uncharacterized protein LOC125706891 isoform X7 n=1 Tax=Brienomyrus brachyistius TaxID=42636 RepID=UPI0020B239C0|nr:uncharacterized protein LOC125706891 isoform X7 [Brienomyrus brachyistius]
MSRRISPLNDAISHVATKTDKSTKLEIKYISPLKGRGVFTLAPFLHGDFIVEYRGELINFAESSRRREVYHKSCTVFMFDFKWSSRTWCIDASIEDGSFGRLVNDDHRNPNCRMKVIKVDGKPHLCLFALRDIKEGEEITYDYGTNDWPWREKHLTNDMTAEKTDKDSGETNQMVTDEDDHLVTSDSAGQQHLTNDMTAEKTDKDSGETNQMVTDEDDHLVTSDSAGQQHLTNDMTAEKTNKDSGETNQMVTDEDDHLVTSDSAGQQSQYSDSEAGADECVPRLRRTRSIKMNEFVPEGSEELFDSLSESGEDYVPNSSEDSESSCSSLSASKSKQKSQDSASYEFNWKAPDSTTVDIEVSCSSEEMEDDDNMAVFTSKIREGGKHAVLVSAVKKKCGGGRAYNKRHYCLYCMQPYSKIARHLEQKHENEREVAKACSFPKGSKQRRMHLDFLRNKGNFAHNAAVIRTGEGQLVACKQPHNESRGDDYLHCAYCQGLFLRKILWRHVKLCKFCPKGTKSVQGKNRVQALCAFAEPAPSEVSKQLWKTLSGMQADEVTKALKNDSHIIKIGEHLLNKKGSSDAAQTWTRQTLRELGRLLVTAKKYTSLKTMEDFINPSKYLEVIKAVQITCGYQRETEKYKIPSLARKLGNSLVKLSKLVKAQALITGNEVLEKKATDFQEVHKEKWNELVSATAGRNAAEIKWNAPSLLPFTRDVQKLHAYLDKTLDECVCQLSSEASVKNWSALAKACLAEIILFNRRREGEVSRMPLSAFLSRDTSGHHDDLDWALSELEKTLCKHYSRIIIRGKRGRPVPVLLTPKMLQALELLVKNRESCGVLEENGYMFARPLAMTHIRGSDCLRRFSLACNASCPKALTSTKLRKHAATLSTILNMSNTEMDQLANFLGHDIRVHREFYRLPEKTLQLAKVSKVLMALEKGRIADFQGKNLDQINIDPNETIDELTEEEFMTEDEVDSELLNKGTTSGAIPPVQREMTIQKRQRTTVTTGTNPGPRIQTKKKWSQMEIQAVERHLMIFLQSGRVPGKADCDKCLKKEPEALKDRDWQSIKYYVHNRIVSNKRKLLSA